MFDVEYSMGRSVLKGKYSKIKLEYRHTWTTHLRMYRDAGGVLDTERCIPWIVSKYVKPGRGNEAKK